MTKKAKENISEDIANENQQEQQDVIADIVEGINEEKSSIALNEKEAELAAAKDQLLRTMAEMDNLRKRTKKQVEDANKYAVSGIAKDLIDVLENLHRAQENISEEQLAESPLVKQIFDGVKLTSDELMNVFKKHGIERIYPKDEQFDHNFHEALAQVPSAEHAPNTVIDVMNAGYVLNGRLLRPAQVAVAVATQ